MKINKKEKIKQRSRNYSYSFSYNNNRPFDFSWNINFNAIRRKLDIKSSRKSKRLNGRETIEERVKLAVGGAVTNGLGTLNYENLNSEIAKQFKTYEIDPKADAESWTVTVTENGITKTYTIYASLTDPENLC